MKTFSLSELRKELALLPASDLADLCLSLAKYRKDNKEFLAYLLVESYDKPGFVNEVKKEIEENFNELKKQPNLYYVKKGLRKLLRIVAKYCKYVDDKAVTCDLHLYFCRQLKESRIPFYQNQLLVNLYQAQLNKISKLIEGLHEDLQADYNRELEEVKNL